MQAAFGNSSTFNSSGKCNVNGIADTAFPVFLSANKVSICFFFPFSVGIRIIAYQYPLFCCRLSVMFMLPSFLSGSPSLCLFSVGAAHRLAVRFSSLCRKYAGFLLLSLLNNSLALLFNSGRRMPPYCYALCKALLLTPSQLALVLVVSVTGKPCELHYFAVIQ